MLLVTSLGYLDVVLKYIFPIIALILSITTLLFVYVDKRQGVRLPTAYRCSRNDCSDLAVIQLKLGRLQHHPYSLTHITLVTLPNESIISYAIPDVLEEKFVSQPKLLSCRNNRQTQINLVVSPLFINPDNNSHVVLELIVNTNEKYDIEQSIRVHFRVNRFPWRTSFSFKISEVIDSTYV